MVKDPVCGMEVDEVSTPHYTHYRHETLFFCSEVCKRSFDMANETARRSWWRKLLDRIIDSNVKVFGRVSSKNEHEGRAEYPLLQQEVKLPKMNMEVDPVCRMEVLKGNAPTTRRYKEKNYYFCAVACAKRFDENPEIYTGGMKNSS